MKVIVLTNPAAGAKADAIDELKDAMTAAGVSATIEPVPGSRLEQSKDFESMMVGEAWIESAKRDLRVALDREVTRIAPPLHYQIRPAALCVLVPSPAPAQEVGAS